MNNPQFPVLYISYDGMLEPLGQSQVVAYLEQLAVERLITLLSFEKPDDLKDRARLEAMRRRLGLAGINWFHLKYHRKPSALATALDLALGSVVALGLVIRYRLRIVHARSYVASVIALTLNRILGMRFVFDMRGFWADERVDAGIWVHDSWLYRIAKWFEKQFLNHASHVVSLTQAGLNELAKMPLRRATHFAATVIPTCADLSKFSVGRDSRSSESFVIGYVGSAGTWYLFDEVASCMRILLSLRSDARILIVNRSEHAFIRQRLIAHHVDLARVELVSSEPEQMPIFIRQMDAALFFVKPTFSKRASAPTRFAEFLGCGVPCLTNSGIGDLDAVLSADRVGVVTSKFDDASLMHASEQLISLASDPQTRDRCVRSAQARYSLSQGVARYGAIYRSLELTQ